MTETQTEPRIRWFIDDLARIHVDGTTTAGAFDVVEIEGRAGDMPPLHVHHDAGEVFCLLEGRISFHLPGRSVELEAGTSVFAPRGIPHVYRIESERARWVVVGMPAGFADFVREASDEPEGEGYPSFDREHDERRLAEAAERYGIELLGPPGTLPS
jgi:mannose-6-phosphate isomerase-like protein (cupin superfamily)